MSGLFENTLIVIPARGGSKGIKGKNVKPLGGKPLLNYSIDTARQLVSDEQICLSSDDDAIIASANAYGLEVPFKRPGELASDHSGMYEVLLHAVDHFNHMGRKYETLILMQPTSPFRTSAHVRKAYELYSPEIDMIVSVKESAENPYYNLFEETNDGYLIQSKPSDFIRRQECPKVYLYNGAIYVINIASLLKEPLHKFKKIRKYIMDDLAIDLDTPEEWQWAEYLLEKKIVIPHA